MYTREHKSLDVRDESRMALPAATSSFLFTIGNDYT